MIEKVNPKHPDKIADRIAGAIVDYAYTLNDNPKIAVEVLIGHGNCHAIIETDTELSQDSLQNIVYRLAGNVHLKILTVPQDVELNNNQKGKVRAGDNGIFKGVPLSNEDKELSKVARSIYKKYSSDGKYILSNNHLTICQSMADKEELQRVYKDALINPLGYWTGGIDVDTGATNRKLGSDMAGSITGGGLHGKDLSKADVSVNIYAFLKAQETNKTIELSCSIGDEEIDGVPYEEIVAIAKKYIDNLGGFEKLAEWGLF